MTRSKRVELTSRGKTWTEVKVTRDIFQGDTFSPLQFVIAMMPLNHKLTKRNVSDKCTKLQERINHLLYMDDIKWFEKVKKNWKL